MTGLERARIVGDPRGGTVALPAGRGFKGRTLVAKTCTGCGALCDAGRFPLTGSARTPDPMCHACHADRMRGRQTYGERRPTVRAHEAMQQAATLATATHRGQAWTGRELEIALNTKIPAVAAAKELGRTRYAVQNVRRRYRAAASA